MCLPQMTPSHDIESENNESVTKSLDEDINYTIDNELHLDVDNIMYGFDNQKMEMKKMLHLLVNQLSKQGSQNVFKIKPTSKSEK